VPTGWGGESPAVEQLTQQVLAVRGETGDVMHEERQISGADPAGLLQGVARAAGIRKLDETPLSPRRANGAGQARFARTGLSADEDGQPSSDRATRKRYHIRR
jgi:hypothetical protein